MVLQYVELQLAENAKVEIFHAQGCWTPEIVDPLAVSPIGDQALKYSLFRPD